MRVLVACEFSGIVRDAFKARGHDAWSCDLQPTERPGNHIQGDVLKIIDNGWDLMIAHPPCQFLSFAGNAWFNESKYGDRARERKKNREIAFQFFMSLVNAPIERICVENPMGYPNSHYRKPDQIINPFQFGDAERKRTCLWLKNLPCLTPVNEVPPPEPLYYTGSSGHARYFTDGFSPSPNRQNDRSRTFQGIANAMKSQWG